MHACTVGDQPFKKVSCASDNVKQAHVSSTACSCTIESRLHLVKHQVKQNMTEAQAMAQDLSSQKTE